MKLFCVSTRKMKHNYYLRKKATYLLLLCLVYGGCAAVRDRSCPASCLCVFDDRLQDSTASCKIDKSTLDVTWSKSFGHVTLSVTCKNATKDQNYKCSDLPQFPVSQEEGWLSIQGCAPGVLRCTTGVFAPNSSLVRAELRNIIGPYNSEDFVNLQHINKLKIKLLSRDVVFPSVAITSLNALNDCIVQGGNLHLSPDELQHPGLQYLQLQENNIKTLPPGVFSGLPNLKFLEIRENIFKHLDNQTFKGLSSLQNLVIERNKLTSIDADTFSSLKRLTTFHLKYNRLERVPNGMFTGLDNLYELRLRTNQVHLTLDTHAFANLSSVRVLEIAVSRVRVLPETLLEGSSNIRQLDLRMNSLVDLPPNLLATNTEVRYLDLSLNILREIPSQLFLTTNKLEYINFGYNNISSIEGINFTHNPGLKEVSLEFNSISEIDFDIFKGTALRSVNLVHNRLQRIAGGSNPTWSTKKLDLSRNKLSVFEDWFVKINGLQYLNLASNRISVFKESHIHNAKSNLTIDLRNNNISEIVRDISDTQLLRTTRHIRLYLSDNPINCNCIITKLLLEWHKSNILSDFNEIICLNKTKIKSLDVIKLCDESFIIQPIILSSILGVIVLCVVVLLCLIRRYKIRKLKRNMFDVDKSKETIKAEVDKSKLKINEDYKVYS